MIEAKKTMTDKSGYFDKYLDARFQHIDETSSRIEKSINETMSRIEEKIEKENKTTRKWLVTTAISLMVGFTAIAVSYLLSVSLP